MKKKLFSFLAAILVLSMLLCTVSCSKKDNPGDTNSSDSVTTDTGDVEYVAPNKKYNGKQITIASSNYVGAWKILDYHIAMKDDTKTLIGEAISRRNAIVEQELGIGINIYPTSQGDRNNYKNLQTAIQTGDKAFDFALPMSSGIAAMLQTEGMLVDLKTISTLDLTHSWWNQNANNEYTIFGKQYAAVGDICFFNSVSPIVTYFSKDMIEENDLPNPYDLAEDNEWTFDTMKSMAIEVSNDSNATTPGVDWDDTFGIAAEQSSLVYWLLSTGERLTGRDADGNVTLTIYNDRSVDIVAAARDILRDESITRALNITPGGSYNSFHKDYAIPKMANGEMLFMSFQLLGGIDMSAQAINFGVVPMPKYDEAQKDYITYGNAAFSDHVIVPGGLLTPDLEMIGYVIESMGYYAQKYITPAVVEQSVTLKGVTDEESAKWIEFILDKQIFDIGYIFDWGEMLNMFAALVTSDADFSSQYASKSGAIIAGIEKSMNAMRG